MECQLRAFLKYIKLDMLSYIAEEPVIIIHILKCLLKAAFPNRVLIP